MKNKKLYFKIYGAALGIFFVLDMIWIGFFANRFYRSRLDYLLAESPDLIAAVIFYLIFVGGLIFFAVRPGLGHDTLLPGIIKSAFYGLITYGTYGLTNLALIENWPVSITIVDMIWGIAASISVRTISILFGKHLKPQGR